MCAAWFKQLIFGNSSKPEEEEQNRLIETPWRRTLGWNLSVRNQLKDHLASLAPVTTGSESVQYFNILITGQIGAGKSSFSNSLNSLYREKIFAPADVGKTARSLTKHYRVYEVKTKPDAEALPWRICDTMGLENGNPDETDVRNILCAVDGHVPNGHEFTGSEFNNGCSEFIDAPELANKAHCVGIVIDAAIAIQMGQTIWNKLRSMRSGLIARNIPTFILLTKVDQLCEHVNKDVELVYRSETVRDVLGRVSNRLMGLPENQIFPIRNYQSEIELDCKMDILLLYAVRQMLYAAQGHLDNKTGN